MWAVGRYDLRLSEDEFWHLTPRQFMALKERHEADQEWKNFRAGVIASTIANALRSKGSKTYKPEDFMPKKRKQKQTWQEQKAVVENYMKTVNRDK